MKQHIQLLHEPILKEHTALKQLTDVLAVDYVVKMTSVEHWNMLDST